ncbi:MAG: hypothetical protein WA958_08355 [Tunicatimonas sp.]
MKPTKKEPSDGRPTFRMKLGIVFTLGLLVAMLCLLSTISQAQSRSTPVPEAEVDVTGADRPIGKLFVP